VETASFELGRIQLRQQVPPKIDLVYLPGVTTESTGQPPDVGSLEEAFAALRAPAIRLLSTQHPVMRLAIGTQLSIGTASIREANELVATRIRTTRFDLKNATDFLYQINRPRESRALPGLLLNRLMKWQAVQWRVLTLEPATGRHYEQPSDTAALLELDLNTQGERDTPLPAASLPALFEELKDLIGQIAEQGDVP